MGTGLAGQLKTEELPRIERLLMRPGLLAEITSSRSPSVRRWGAVQSELVLKADHYTTPQQEMLLAAPDLDDTFLDVLRMATDEYCNAQERPHFGCIEARVPLPEFARGCGFNWVPRASGDDVDARRLPTELTHSPILFEHPMLKNLEQDIEPFVLLYDTDQ